MKLQQQQSLILVGCSVSQSLRLLEQGAAGMCDSQEWENHIPAAAPLSSPFGKCLFLFLSFLSLFIGAELTQICHSAAGVVQTLGVLGVQLPGPREFRLGR